jgi:eukaryotic-like serine/threonine-protein kinase
VNDSADPLRGTPYKTLRRIGVGGMGEVFEVEHRGLKKVFVAKLLRPEFAKDAGLVDRLRLEAQALAALSHPNLVNVTDLGQARDRRPYFIMERLQGRTLAVELSERGAFPQLEAIGRVRELLSALGAAHALGIVHRDVKLQNLFLHDAGGSNLVLKVLDFGVAKVLNGASSRAPAPPALATIEGLIVGTPRFISPEQALGKWVDQRADLYAAGLVLYSLIVGRGPFDDLRGPELVKAHSEREPEPPSRYAPDFVPRELDEVVLKALRKQPEDRFQRAEDFERALQRLEDFIGQTNAFLQTEVIPLHDLPDATLTTREISNPSPEPESAAPIAGTPREPTKPPRVPTERLPDGAWRIFELPTRTADQTLMRRARRFAEAVKARIGGPERLAARYGLAILAGLAIAAFGVLSVSADASAWAVIAVTLGAAIAAAAVAILLNRFVS